MYRFFIRGLLKIAYFSKSVICRNNLQKLFALRMLFYRYVIIMDSFIDLFLFFSGKLQFRKIQWPET